MLEQKQRAPYNVRLKAKKQTLHTRLLIITIRMGSFSAFLLKTLWPVLWNRKVGLYTFTMWNKKKYFSLLANNLQYGSLKMNIDELRCAVLNAIIINVNVCEDGYLFWFLAITTLLKYSLPIKIKYGLSYNQ